MSWRGYGACSPGTPRHGRNWPSPPRPPGRRPLLHLEGDVPGLTFDNVVAGGFALCRVRTCGAPEMGVVVDGAAYSLSAVLGSAVASADVLFPDWDAHLDKLQAWSDAQRAGQADASPVPS